MKEKLPHLHAELVAIASGEDYERDLQALKRGRSIADVRRELRDGGEAPPSLVIRARTFIQRPTPNRNFVRFKDSIRRRFARSFAGMPFLLDHNRDQAARIGTIVASELAETADGWAIEMDVEVVKAEAIASVLDGTIDRFSIGWSILGGYRAVICSACKGPMFSGECPHYPGDKLEDGTFVEAIIPDAEGVEVSAVTVPAVVGTEVQEIRAALSACRSSLSQEASSMKFATIMLAALGLAADSDEKAVTVAVEKLKTDRDRFESLLDAEKSAHTETKAALAAADKELTAQREAERKAKVDGLIADARREGKLKLAHDDQGNPVETKVEKAIKRLASTDIEAAKEYVADLPRIIPVVASADEKVDRPVMGAEGLSEVQRRTNAALGITDEMWKKHNPPPAAQ